jgi:glycyl-tRNA synthetase beta chain
VGELLLELLSEEIPARMQRWGLEMLLEQLNRQLRYAFPEIAPDAVRGYVTPRRVTFIAEGVPSRQPATREEWRGPRVGAPQSAIDGFLRATGFTTIEACKVVDTPRGKYYFASIDKPGRNTADILAEFIPKMLADNYAWQKKMRFPAASFRWVRPLVSVICLFDGEIVPLHLDRILVGRTTRGHRFLSEGDIAVDNAADYLDRLEAAYVILDQDRRRRVIAADLDRLGAERGVTVKPDPDLLDEVTGLVEFPVVLIGAIDADFVRPLPDGLPLEVLATAMRTHQKYFTCLNSDGSLAPRFLCVANNRTPDGGKTVIAGNERVLRARLADARFFWDQDRKVRLEDRVEALKQRVYHERLGSVYDKVERMKALAAFLAESIRWPQRADQPQPIVPQLVEGFHAAPASGDYASSGVDGRDEPSRDGQGELKRLACRAARLAKADLSTGMVGEFPELQGVMGRYYVLHDEGSAVADAIADHYRPLGPNDACPTAPISIVAALADKIDSLVAFFAIGEAPTGSRDPYALRRAAQGVIRIILENNLRLPLRSVVVAAAALIPIDYQNIMEEQNLAGELLAFIADRLKVHLREKGVRHDLIAAVFSLGEDDLVRLLARVRAIERFLTWDDGANLLVAYRRAVNIVAIEEKKDRRSYNEPVDRIILREPEEKQLSVALDVLNELPNTSFVVGGTTEDFSRAMTALASLRQPVDAFFDKVTVNTDDAKLRRNRLRLLSAIRATMNRVADFSQIEG